MGPARIGVIGVGGIGKVHLAALHEQPDWQIVGIADVNPATLRKAGELYPYKQFENPDALFEQAAPEYVVICTPHFEHVPLAIAAMERGIHALVEKPFAIQASAADEAMRVSARTGCRLGVSFNMRPRPLHARLRQLLAEKAIGNLTRITMIATDWFRSMHYYRSSAWRASWRGEGGGILANQAPHDLDLLIEMAGMPCEVTAEVATVGHAIEVEDSVSALLAWPNGACGQLHVSTNEFPGRTMFELVGTRGVLTLEPERLTLLKLQGDTREISDNATDNKMRPAKHETVIWDATECENRYRMMHRNFVEAFRNGAQLICPPEEGIKEVELANAILIAGVKRHAVHVPAPRAEFDALLQELQEAGNLATVKARYELNAGNTAK